MNRCRMTIVTAVFLVAVAAMLAFTRHGASETTDRVIKIAARRFEFSPGVIHLKRSVPVVLELTTLDRRHGFKSEGLGLRAEIRPGEISAHPGGADQGRHLPIPLRRVLRLWA